ncbi:hypothetical protein C5Y97_13140 [Blastopirellula marina]|uniref:Uncharacterized protein n=1 Tax=Blastopirellula marina TaxID=124 RepID=A0A2S8GUN2_9BACT|nr:hypothetical protein C5Y98_13130 [Blastopirellula marina]PQO48091.1 hypothetical protein C5Y93_01525 [Blastopirellula marina]PTL44222.1 hypothetical protein C5Y97_13140 [Blastopirellula marina]
MLASDQTAVHQILLSTLDWAEVVTLSRTLFVRLSSLRSNRIACSSFRSKSRVPAPLRALVFTRGKL